MLTREHISNLRKVLHGKNVIILGHDNIDVDAVLSGLLLSKLLHFWGIENIFCVLDEVKEDESFNILKELFSIDITGFQNPYERAERVLFLVDHYETVHLGKVIGIIDHHPNHKELDYEFKYVRNSCATAYMVYELMKQASYPFCSEDIRQVIAAMLIDTVSFKSTKTVEEEIDIALNLAKDYNIDIDSLEQYALRITDITQMSDEEIISNGIKWYSYKRKNDVASSYLQLNHMPEENVRNKWIDLLKEKLEKTGADMFVFIIYDMNENKTLEYQISKDKVRFILHSKIMSRGKDIMPRIEEMFKI